ncbi:MAG: LysR substrate-binding domain-containing protein [Rhodospirillaceae bacterium]
MSLNLHLLRLFAAVAHHRGFSRAAEALHISQPAVSRGVRELEEQVGNRLLERGPDGVAPTEAGRILLRHAEPIFAAERQAEEDLAALRGLSAGSLSIGASTTISTWYLPPLLSAYHHAHPGVRLRLSTANTSEIVDLLVNRNLDVALVEGPIAHPSIRFRPWRKDRLVWIASPDHPLARSAAPLSSDILGGHLIVVREPGSGTRDVGRAAMREHGIDPQDILEVESTEAIKQVVVAGMGIALVSEAAVRPQLTLGELKILPVRDFSATRWLNRVSLAGRQPSAAAAAFERLLDAGQDQDAAR